MDRPMSANADIPAPPRPTAAAGEPLVEELPLQQQLEEETRWKTAHPEAPYEFEVLVTPPVDVEAEAAGPAGVRKASSEDDIIMYGQKVHVHGELAKKEVHPPQHAPKNINYARVAREEIHDVAENPPPVKLTPGKTGVEEWDKVNSPRMGRAGGDARELLVLGMHKAEP